MTLTYILHSIDFDTIYVDIPDLLNYKVYNYQILHSASPRGTDSVVTLTHFESTFDISSTIRPTTIKPCKVLLLNVLTRQIPLPGDLDLYFGCIDFDIIYVNVSDLLKCKTSSHQTLHSASPRCTDSAGSLNCKAFNHQTLYSASSRCTDSAGTLTWWPWPIFCTPVTDTF